MSAREFNGWCIFVRQLAKMDGTCFWPTCHLRPAIGLNGLKLVCTDLLATSVKFVTIVAASSVDCDVGFYPFLSASTSAKSRVYWYGRHFISKCASLGHLRRVHLC